jgi:hypothetical protein
MVIPLYTQREEACWVNIKEIVEDTQKEMIKSLSEGWL